MNENYMYEQEAAVAALHQIEGFDPRKFMRLIEKEGQLPKYYLDVAYRKLWFRLCYPEGKNVKVIRNITAQMAIVEARVYLNKNDPDDSYVANAFAQKYREDSEIGQKYVELAETAAVGRALSDAGFGLQFADREKEMDPEVTEAPIDRSVMEGEPLIPGDFSETTDPEMEADFPEESIPGQCDIGDYIPMPGEVLERSKEENKTPVREVRKATKETSTSLEERFLQQNATPESVQGISKNMPVAEIYRKLNRDLAVRVVVSAGCYKGKTLGQIAVEKPGALQWYVDSYKGPDNLLRAAAKYLLDQALAPAC